MAKKKSEFDFNMKDLQAKAEEVIELAKQNGVETDYFFLTTFKRYQIQMETLEQLEKALKESGALVTKEYVKGRENIYTHPAINAYNNTTNSANRTVITLIKIVNGFKETKKKAKDPLMELLNGGDED